MTYNVCGGTLNLALSIYLTNLANRSSPEVSFFSQAMMVTN